MGGGLSRHRQRRRLRIRVLGLALRIGSATNDDGDAEKGESQLRHAWRTHGSQALALAGVRVLCAEQAAEVGFMWLILRGFHSTTS